MACSRRYLIILSLSYLIFRVRDRVTVCIVWYMDANGSEVRQYGSILTITLTTELLVIFRGLLKAYLLVVVGLSTSLVLVYVLFPVLLQFLSISCLLLLYCDSYDLLYGANNRFFVTRNHSNHRPLHYWETGKTHVLNFIYGNC